MRTFRPARCPGPVAFGAAALLAACASTEVLYDPGKLTPAQAQQCKVAERAYREGTPDYPALRAGLERDPVAIAWFARMLVRDLFAVREGRPLGEDQEVLRAAARIEDPVETRALAEIHSLGALAVPVIVGDLLRNPQPQPRELGIELVARIGAPALPALLSLAADRQARHRRAAARALGAVGGEAAFAALRRLAADGEYTVRADALGSLPAGMGPAARDLLLTALRDDVDAYARQRAAKALAEHPSPQVAGALIDYLARCERERDARGERAAQETLRRLSGSRTPRTVEAWRKWAQGWQPAPDGR
ncbi:MAG: hypothetical protein FJ265_00615 [Planctomycetes bacterium]|nr:hypothetical protein [Planctomycetota bacterium]